MKKRNILYTSVASLLICSCAVVRPGEVGVKQTLGKFSEKISTEGIVFYNPFISKVVKENTQTSNIRLILSLPSKEGLSVKSEISILYRLNPQKLKSVLSNLGTNYESVITSVFRSAASDVCAKFYAKDMHSGMRADIENSIKTNMENILAKQADGIDLIAVLMKSIKLPDGLANSIERKLQAEQEAMRMEFVIDREKQEAARKIINAKGERDSQKVLAEGLTDQIIQIKTIEAFKELSKSNNAKVIITDGKTPLMINNKE